MYQLSTYNNSHAIQDNIIVDTTVHSGCTRESWPHVRPCRGLDQWPHEQVYHRERPNRWSILAQSESQWLSRCHNCFGQRIEGKLSGWVFITNSIVGITILVTRLWQCLSHSRSSVVSDGSQFSLRLWSRAMCTVMRCRWLGRGKVEQYSDSI